MPGRDRTGPVGRGPLTGGGFGDCTDYPSVGPRAPRGFGAWGGRGWRHWFRATGLPGWQRAGLWQTPSPEEEADLLRSQSENLRSMLDQVESRLRDLKEDGDE